MTQCKNCLHDETQHDPTTKVCLVSQPGTCYCMTFDTRIPKRIFEIEKYVKQYIDVEDRVQALLEKIPNARNIDSKAFCFLYWHIFSDYIVPPKIRKDLEIPETIARAKRKLVEKEVEQWGPYDSDTVEAKGIKELATAEWAIYN